MTVIGGGLVLVVVLVAGSAAAVVAALAGELGGALTSTGTVPSQPALAEIPSAYLETYLAAAATCPGLPWTVLAGIGQAETDQGRNDHVSSAGAEGPMQFEPATFAQYDQPVPPGGANPPNPYDPIDAIYAAARDLCANGARGGRDIPGAIYTYNHDQSYVTEVLAYAAAYEAPAATAVSYAVAQIGTPYRWGGESPGVGFDCSGLVQAAYAAAGIGLPRVAQAQYHAGPPVPPGEALQPGDLVFFGASPTDITHVGIVLGDGEMIDAPHTGAVVRVEPYDWPDYIGATRPAPAPA